MVDPTDTAAREQLAAKLGAPFVAHVVAELRALYYLEKLYGLPRRARFVRSGRAASQSDDIGEERRRSQPVAGMVMPPSFTLEPRRRRTSSQVPMSRTRRPTTRRVRRRVRADRHGDQPRSDRRGVHRLREGPLRHARAVPDPRRQRARLARLRRAAQVCDRADRRIVAPARRRVGAAVRARFGASGSSACRLRRRGRSRPSCGPRSARDSGADRGDRGSGAW